jgi:hypothetical protein
LRNRETIGFVFYASFVIFWLFKLFVDGVIFGTPNMFVTLWFRFDYGTNLPLVTLII